MNIVYLIDSENVNDAWVELLPVLDHEDQIIVFYTDKSPHMCYQNVIALLNNDKKVEFIKCFAHGWFLSSLVKTDIRNPFCCLLNSGYILECRQVLTPSVCSCDTVCAAHV